MTRRNSCCFFLPVLTMLALSVPGGADVFLLRDGGTVEGEWLNSDETPKRTYRVRSSDGVEIVLDAKQVERIRKGDRETLIEYNEFAPMMEDTIENHLEIAEWCSKNRLPELARRHRHQVLEHDPDHKQARQVLGYFKDADGQWTTQEEMLGSRGRIRHNNSWKSQQQIDLEQIVENRKKLETAWTARINGLRASLPRGEQARSEMLSINDPAAISALWQALNDERNEDTRILIIKALSNIGTPAAVRQIAQWSLNVRELPELRRACFDEIKKHPEAKQAIVAFYESWLGDVANPAVINAAALGIGEIDGHTAIPKLIDALITVHKYKEKQKAPPTTFGNTGNVQGMTHASGEKVVDVTKPSENREVRAALMKLTGADFQFNKDAWRAWLIQQRRTSSFNARRG